MLSSALMRLTSALLLGLELLLLHSFLPSAADDEAGYEGAA